MTPPLLRAAPTAFTAFTSLTADRKDVPNP
jgi:hypothetical protein